MTELTVRPGTNDDSSLTLLPPAQPAVSTARLMLREHAEMMGEAHQLAQAMCNTQMVPMRFRGKPDDGAAAILYGGELGLNPIQSLQRVVPIHGMPSLEARTMVALLKARGYKIKTTAQSDDAVTVEGVDLDGEHYSSTWTIERATKAGYVPTRDAAGKFKLNGNGKLIGNEKYLSDPQAMLKAKAQAEVCRDMAPDVLLGMPYTREDLESEAFDEHPARRSGGVIAKLNERAAAPVETISVDEVPAFAGLVQDAPQADPAPIVKHGLDVPARTVYINEPDPAAAAAADDVAAAAPPVRSNAEITREKWLGRLIDLLTEANVSDTADQLTVAAKVAGTAPLINLTTLPDKQLRAAVNTLAAWSKSGELDVQATEILNAATLAAEAGDGQ